MSALTFNKLNFMDFFGTSVANENNLTFSLNELAQFTRAQRQFCYNLASPMQAKEDILFINKVEKIKRAVNVLKSIKDPALVQTHLAAVKKDYLTLQTELNDDIKHMKASYDEFESAVFPPVSKTNPLMYLGLALCGAVVGAAAGITLAPLAFSAAAIYACVKQHVNQNYALGREQAINQEMAKKQEKLNYLHENMERSARPAPLRNPATLRA